MKHPKSLDCDSQDRKTELENEGFLVETFWAVDKYLFHVTTPEGVSIAPMSEIEAYWMLCGWKAAKYGKR